MSNETSKLAQELEQMLNRNAMTTQTNVSRVGIKIENTEASIRRPVRIQQPMIQRQQYYTGDA